MGKYFFDTSALVKRFRPESGSESIDALFSEPESVFAISRLGIIEFVSALALKVRAGDLPVADYSLARKKFLGEVSQGNLQVFRLLVTHFRTAEQLIDQHAQLRRFRTLDALQLSVAIDLQRNGFVEVFVCADAALCEIAALEGLKTVNPLDTMK